MVDSDASVLRPTTDTRLSKITHNGESTQSVLRGTLLAKCHTLQTIG